MILLSRRLALWIVSVVVPSAAFVMEPRRTPSSLPRSTTTPLQEMKRPLLDQIASTLFQLETNRVKQSSVEDEQGRVGEPMEWSESNSLANQFSELMARGPGYGFKQWVANLVAGDYDKAATQKTIRAFVKEHDLAMFSFTTCPFCRRAKDALQEKGYSFVAMELDQLPDNKGNEIRAALGETTKRTSVPSIFVKGTFVGGCNDGPGLLPLLESGELDRLLSQPNV